MGSHSLLQGIFLTQGSSPGLPYCRQILYCLSHQGSRVFFLSCIGDISPLTCVLNIFPICVLLFTLFMAFVVQKFLIFMLSHVSVCFFIVCSICAMPRSFHPKSYKYSPVLSSSTFKA